MKYFLCLGIVLVAIALRINYVDAKHFVHFGRCNSSRFSEGSCRSLDDCTTLDANQKQNTDLLSELNCGSNLKALICCPKTATSPQSRYVLLPPVLPQPPSCGQMILQNKIFNGVETAIDEFPWMVIVLYSGANENSLCGGTLISDLFVLTAAHCVDKKTVSGVRLGEWNTATNPDCQRSKLGNEDCAPQHVVIKAKSPIIHPDYQTSESYPNDIALIPLSQKVTITDFIRPICLPPADTGVNAYADITMNIAGWGRNEDSLSSSHKMLKADVPIWQRETCQEFARSNRFELSDHQICGGKTSGSCQGDSGGPLMQNKNKRFYQAGIISLGGNCKDENRPMIFTKVDAYINWIKNEVELSTLIDNIFLT